MIADNLEAEKYRTPPVIAEVLAFAFWVWSGIKICVFYLLFRDDPITGNIAGGLISIALVLLILFLVPVVAKRQRGLGLPQGFGMALIFVLWTGATILWTQAASQVTAIGYWVATFTELLFVLLLPRLGPFDRIAVRSLQGLVLGGAVFAVFAFTITSGGDRLGDGSTISNNTVGHHMALAGFCSLYVLQTTKERVGRIFWSLTTLIVLLALLQSLSKTAIIAFLLGAVLYGFRSRMTPKQVLVMGLLTVGTLLVSLPEMIAYMDTYLNETQDGQALETVSGRTSIWEQGWAMIQANPIWGYGYLSVRDVGPQIIAHRLVHLHNEWLNIWFSYGAIGLMLAVLAYLRFHRRICVAFRTPASAPKAALAEALLVYSLVRGLTEASVTGLVFPLTLMAMLLLWFKAPDGPPSASPLPAGPQRPPLHRRRQ